MMIKALLLSLLSFNAMTQDSNNIDPRLSAIELTGVWKGKNEVYYSFKDDGTFTFSAPLLKYSKQATEIISGLTLIGPKIQLLFNNGGDYESFEIQEVLSDKLVVFDKESSMIVLERLILNEAR